MVKISILLTPGFDERIYHLCMLSSLDSGGALADILEFLEARTTLAARHREALRLIQRFLMERSGSSPC